ncbi:aquaporin-9-like [Babylonia areolata]|uniref:aquaporin-9-like n=1 Tax=Babylonia areolata TaxID=304850 RepID=UPI003FD4DCCB
MGLKKHLRIPYPLVREMLAELIGTFILVTFAVGSAAQLVLGEREHSSPLTTYFAGGMGLTFGIYWAGGVSGGYLNPAVTLAMCLHGVVPWYKLPFYGLAELLGAFLAAAVQFGVFYDALNARDGGERITGGPNGTAKIFATFPNPEVSTLNCFFDQVFGAFILIGCILAITDRRNMKPDTGLMPIALGAIVFAIGTCWALNCGYALNPARDLGPRLFMAVAGWGLGPFRFRQYYWFWVPIFGPFCGAFVAWAVYNIFIDLHWPDEVEDLKEEVTSAQPPQNGKVKDAGADNPAFVQDPVDGSTHL